VSPSVTLRTGTVSALSVGLVAAFDDAQAAATRGDDVGLRRRRDAALETALGVLLPRVKRSTKGEGHERRYFYGSVWAVCWAQPTLWLMWKVIPRTRPGDTVKLVVFLSILAVLGNLARLGRLPRTRPIVPGEIAVSD